MFEGANGGAPAAPYWMAPDDGAPESEYPGAGFSAPGGDGPGEDDYYPSAQEPSDLPPDIQERLALLEQLEGYAPVVAALQQQGFTDAASVERQLAVQQEVYRRGEAMYHAYQERIDRGELSVEAAQELYEREAGMIEREVALDLISHQYGDSQVESAISQALDAYPDTLRSSGPEGRGLVKLLHQTTGAPVHDVAQFVHELVAGSQNRAVAAYAAQLGLGGPVPQTPGGGIFPQSGPGGNEHSSWADLLGIGR